MPRTALDLARFVRPDDLLSIIEQAMHDGHLTVEEMMAVAVDFISPQRPWLTTYLDQLVRRAGGAPAESDPEVRIRAALLAAGISGLERQYPIDLPGYGRARFDLAVPSLRWAIEVDVHPAASRNRRHRERSPPRPRLPGGGLVDVACLSGRLRGGLRRHHRRPPPGARAFSLGRSREAPRRCRCGALLPRHRHRPGDRADR